MIQTINFSGFCDGFTGSYKNCFSYEGKRALFDYFEQIEEETGEPIELDPIAICCDYTEYESMEELQASYPNISSIVDLEEKTQVIPILPLTPKKTLTGFIIQNF